MYILTSEWMTSSKPTSELFECDYHQQFSGLAPRTMPPPSSTPNVSTFSGNKQTLSTRPQPTTSTRLFPPLTPSPSPRRFPTNAPCAVSKSIIRIHLPSPLSESFADSRRRLPPATRTAARRPCEDSERRRGEDSGCGGGGARDRNCYERIAMY